MMSPYRKRRNWIFLLLCVVIIAAFVLAAWLYRVRVNDLERLVYQNCVANERQDAIIVTQLEAAMVRARTTLPAGSAVQLSQLEILGDGIAALEPPDERECVPPEGTDP